MHLKSLTMRGFKSFASATTLEFEPGITCVVGPNGSGKSNVVDAIAWVMGEQGAKSLRGGKMEDVIFAGGSGRPPLGRAEVELVIDNSDGSLPIDFTEVRISRILFRTGGSEYSINGEPARLLDVQELLSDSGIGREMHVIVGQGRLDSVLHATTEDRRGFIEEAAGILKHRKRKEKALRKLDAMAANLVRLQDLTGELRRQLKPLGRQAVVARRAAVIQADLRDAKLRILADDFVGATSELGREEAHEAAILEHRAAVQADLRSSQERQRFLEAEASEAAPRLMAITDLQVRFASLQERFVGIVRLAEERLRNLRTPEPEQLGLLDPDRLDREAHAAREAHARLAAAAQEAARELDVRAAAHAAARGRLVAAAETAQARARTIKGWEDEVARARARLSRAESRAEVRRAEIARNEAQLDATRARLPELEEQLARAQPVAAGSESDEADLAAGAEKARARWAAAREAVERAVAADREAGQSVSAAAARVRALKESTPEPVSIDILAAAGLHVLGPVSDLIEVADGWQTAVAVVLGHVGEGVAIADPSMPAGAAARLRTESDARTTLVRASASRRGRAHAVGGDLPVGAVWARDVIRPARGTDPEAAKVVASLLTGVALVDDLEAGERVIAEVPDARAATRTGELLSPEFLVVGPPGAGAIERRAQVDQAVAELAAFEESQTRCSQVLADARAHAAECEDEAVAAGTRLDSARKEATEQAGTEALIRTRITAVEQELNRIEQVLEQSRQALAADVEEASGSALALERLRSEGAPTGPVDEAELAGLEADVVAAREAEFDGRLASQSAAERADAQARRAVELAAAAEEERTAIDARQRRAVERERAGRVAERVLSTASAALGIIETSLAEVRERRESAAAHRTETEGQLGRIRETVAELSLRLEELTASYHRDEVARAEQRMRIEQLAARAFEEGGLTPEALIAEYGPATLVPPSPPAPGDDVDPSVGLPDPKPFVRAEQERRLRESEKALALLGRVNPLALEEFAAMEERHSFLTAQVEDLKQSRKDLLEIVAEVDARVRAVFGEAFVDVQREFSEVFARLFPGGEGRLVLTDPDDMLLTGIEVEARPAGKRVKRLSLLSGGERSLTAMAFLVALFKARPAPFYLLDEVEAALDDHNLARLVGLMSELRESSQILVITHQKRTMEVADVLYGVTMRGGVTQVVSQRMRELQPA